MKKITIVIFFASLISACGVQRHNTNIHDPNQQIALFDAVNNTAMMAFSLSAACGRNELGTIKEVFKRRPSMKRERDESRGVDRVTSCLISSSTGVNVSAEVVQYLVGQGAKVNKTDNQGIDTAKLIVAQSRSTQSAINESYKNLGMQPPTVTSIPERIDILNLLVSKGADLTKTYPDGSTLGDYDLPAEMVTYLSSQGVVFKKAAKELDDKAKSLQEQIEFIKSQQ